MATVMDRAAKGCRKALMQLYENNKTSVYVTAELLLGNGDTATDVAASVFTTAWKELANTKMDIFTKMELTVNI